MSYYKGFTSGHLESHFGVRFAKEGVVVPYREKSGETHREKLFSPEGEAKCWLGDPKEQVAYGLETLSHGGLVAFLTEGESCAWALRAEFPRTPVLGLPGASSWKPGWAELVREFQIIYMSFDGDAAGEKLTDTVWPYLPWARRVKLPEGSDTRDILQLKGGEAYERLLRDADNTAGCTRFILETPARLGGLHVAV